MATFEYGLTVKGIEVPTTNKRELVVEQMSENYVRIALRGEGNGAIVSFLQDGTIKIYRGTAEDAGFNPVIF